MPRASRSNNLPSVGVDIVEIRRLASAARRRRGFLERIFSPEEIRYCRARRDPWPHFAARFAAKEAVWKACGLRDLALKDISVRRGDRGGPEVLLRGRRAPGVTLSLSHGEVHAVAVALSLSMGAGRRRSAGRRP